MGERKEGERERARQKEKEKEKEREKEKQWRKDHSESTDKGAESKKTEPA